MQLNEEIMTLPEGTLSVERRVAEFRENHPDSVLIRLDQDLMNMPLPPTVTAGMQEAVLEVSRPDGIHLSSPWSGYESLKHAIARHLAERGAKVLERDVFITSGLESAHACLSNLFGPANSVLLPDPGERSLWTLHRCAGRNLSFSRALPENRFRPEPPAVRGADLVFLSSPSTVTGVAMDRLTLQKWVDWANENDCILFFDASLAEYVRSEDCPRSIYELEGAEHCAVELFSFEKGYGVTELKIAYVIIPSTLCREGKYLRDLWCARQPATATPPSYVMQHAAELLFSEEARAETEKLLYRIQKVGRLLSEGLSAAGIPHVGAADSPFLWAQCPRGMNSWQCFDTLLDRERLVVTPGSLFGYSGERFVRLTAFGLPEEAVQTTVRLCELFSEPPAKT